VHLAEKVVAMIHYHWKTDEEGAVMVEFIGDEKENMGNGQRMTHS
jgi:hypothetical protein